MKCISRLFLALSLLFIVFVSPGQQKLHNASASEAAMDKELLSRVDQLIQQYVDSQWIAGATAIVARDGKIVYHKGFGYSNIDSKKPQQVDDIFRIASQTKAIVSVAVMMLYEQGKLLLDDPVAKYIPAFANPKVIEQFNLADTSYTTVPAKRAITIRDLLTHTSGIGYANIGSKESNAMYAKAGVHAQFGVAFDDWQQQMNRIASLPLLHQPGERWSYGLNTDMLGFLIQVITGQSLADFLRANILDPLGMKDTWFYLPKDKQSRLVKLHTQNNAGKAILFTDSQKAYGYIDVDYPLQKGNLYSGGAGLVSTVYDYAIFMQMMLNGGIYDGVRIISKNSVDMMTQNQIGSINKGTSKFGLGFEIVTEESSARLGQSIGTYSWGGAFSSSYWIDPKEKLVGQLFINQTPNSHGEIHDKFKVLVYSAID